MDKRRICFYLPEDTITLINVGRKIGNYSKGRLVEKAIDEYFSKRTTYELVKTSDDND